MAVIFNGDTNRVENEIHSLFSPIRTDTPIPPLTSSSSPTICDINSSSQPQSDIIGLHYETASTLSVHDSAVSAVPPPQQASIQDTLKTLPHTETIHTNKEPYARWDSGSDTITSTISDQAPHALHNAREIITDVLQVQSLFPNVQILSEDPEEIDGQQAINSGKWLFILAFALVFVVLFCILLYSIVSQTKKQYKMSRKQKSNKKMENRKERT